jgi:hypothetical protein
MRAKEFIIESTDEDRAIISLAHTIWQHIQSYANSSKTVNLGAISSFMDTPLSALNNIKIVLGDDDTMNKENSGSNADHLTSVQTSGMWIAETDTILLNLSIINERSMRRTIAHELRHALDDMKSNYHAGSSHRYNSPKMNQNSDDSYKSSNAEINARFAEVLYAMTVYIKNAKEKEIENPHEYVMDKFHTMMDQKQIYKYFPEKEKSKLYKRLVSRATDFIAKEMVHIFKST